MKALTDNTTIEHIGLFGNHDNMERRHAHNSPWVARSHPTEPPACLGPPFWARERGVLAAWMPMIRGVAVALSWCRCPRRVDPKRCLPKAPRTISRCLLTVQEDDLPKIYKVLEPRRDAREMLLSQGAR